MQYATIAKTVRQIPAKYLCVSANLTGCSNNGNLIHKVWNYPAKICVPYGYMVQVHRLSPKERIILRITTKQYINLILQKKNITQMELLRKIKSIEPENAEKMHIEHLNEAINNRLIPIWAYRIEKALDLEKGTLLKLYKGRK